MPERETQTTILVAARYASVRAGLRALIENEAGLQVVGDVQSSDDLERESSNLAPDVILIDFDDEIGRLFVETAIDDGAAIVLLGSPQSNWSEFLTLAQNGVALLGKEADQAEIVGGIRSASAGLVTLDRNIALLMTSATPLPAGLQSSHTPHSDLLSAREREVLQLLSLGLPNKQIATRLKISQHTVKFHVASILVKLGASSRTEAVTLGARRGEVVL